MKKFYFIIVALFLFIGISNVNAQDEPCTATAIGSGLTAGTTGGFTETSTLNAPNPVSCSGFDDNGLCWDPWFVYTVPINGNVTFGLDNVTGGTGSSARFVLYTGASCASLNQVGCGSNDLATQDVTLTGLTSGQQIYIRVYDWGCDPIAKTFNVRVSTMELNLDASTTGSIVNLTNCPKDGSPSVRLYDSGGGALAGYYGNNENYNITFNAPANCEIWVKEVSPIFICPGRVGGNAPCNNSDGNDYLKLFDGTNLVRNLTGNSLGFKFGSYKTNNGSLGITWESGASGFTEGWALEIYCIPTPVSTSVDVACGNTISFTDPGGPGGNYGNNAHRVWTFCPDAFCPDQICVDMGLTDLEDTKDVLYVFDGPSTNSPLHSFYQEDLNNIMGTIRATYANFSGCLTFMLVSDEVVNNAGWNASVGTCEFIGPNGADDCANATDISAGGTFQSNTFAATGSPFGPDPNVNIGGGSCDPTLTSVSDITQLESTIWYKFTVPSLICSSSTFNFSVDNVSCYQDGVSSGAQFVLYETNSCAASGAAWDANRVYCADIIQSGAGVNIPTGVITPGNTYYIMMDAFAGRFCDLDLIFRVVGDDDNDGICDIIDLDDDNDGIPDTEEVCGPGATSFFCLPGGADPSADADGDGTPNWADPNFCNGCVTDTDGAGVPDYLDTDSDNDGCYDTVEAGFSDPDDDGIVGSAPFTDTDQDGWSDVADPSNGGTPSSNISPAYDPNIVACEGCDFFISSGTNICAEINYDPTHPLAGIDCDNGGIDNYTECISGNDPLDADDDCEAAVEQAVDICALITSANHPLAALDCDEGGVDNFTECNNGGDPIDPVDDCLVAVTTANFNICGLIINDPTHPLASQDCDEGGVDNLTECTTGNDPANPADDCQAAGSAGLNICGIIGNDPTHPMANLDCDNGGVDNYTECSTGEDPSDPSDDCQSAIDDPVLDICSLINGDINHPFAFLDCDNGGVDNYTECINGANPDNNPSDDCLAVLTSPTLDLCTIINNDISNPLANLDCDGGGVPNIIECNSGGDPGDPADDCQSAIDSGTNICGLINNSPLHPMANLDCDGGGVDNYTECTTGEDPSDPSDDCDAAVESPVVDICGIIISEPNNPIATEDCDNGGVDNQTECNNGGNPNDDPSDDCAIAIADPNYDICVEIGGNANHPLANLDCDGGGVPNIIECNSGEDPTNPADDCMAAIDSGILICGLIAPGGILDPTHPMAALDCDNGGIDNLTECQNGGNPADPSDDCDAAINANQDICTLVADPNHPLAGGDCDGDGVTNATECNNDTTDPLDPCDYNSGSVTLAVTADQSGCADLCPDLSPVITVVPGNIQSVAAVGVAIEVFELNNVNTSGSSILVRVPSDPRLTFTWNPTLTSVAFTTINNSAWNYLGDNGIVHQFLYTGVQMAGTITGFGFESTYDPQNTDGQTTITSTIVPFSGGECNILNNSDAERLVYFE